MRIMFVGNVIRRQPPVSLAKLSGGRITQDCLSTIAIWPPRVAHFRAPYLTGEKMLSTSANINYRNKSSIPLSSIDEHCSTLKMQTSIDTIKPEYARAIYDLNSLQSNTQAVALAKYKDPKQILPLFEKQLNLAGIQVSDLDQLNIIHVSGTKGKGSTCAFLESLLRGAGLKTGFYNSPHLIKVTERIKLDGNQIDEAKFCKYFRYVYERLLGASKTENITLPSYFSFLTILAYHIFLEERVDCAIIEVGIGGKYDPTNIVSKPVACGITNIHFDHTNILGDTIESIAESKAGIAKHGVPIFTVQQEHRSAIDVIKASAEQKNCPFYICKPLDNSQKDVELGIKGTVQYENASLACQLANYFITSTKSGHQQFPQPVMQILDTSLDQLPTSFRKSLASCSWPGRCQIIKYSSVSFYLDGAHTKESMENCLRWYLSEVEGSREHQTRILMVNIIGERNKYEILKPLAGRNFFDKVIFSTNRINSLGDTPKSETFVNMQTPNNDRSIENVNTNARIWNSLVQGQGPLGDIKANIAESLELIADVIRQNPNSLHSVLVTGSLHFIGAVLETLPNYDSAFVLDK